MGKSTSSRAQLSLSRDEVPGWVATHPPSACPPVRVRPPLRRLTYRHDTTAYRRQVMKAVPHRMILQNELTGERRVAIE